MKIKNKTKKILLLLLFMGLLFGGFLLSLDLNGNKSVALAADAAAPTQFNYTLLESFPGFYQAKSTMTDFPALILAIYKFGIWTVGIAGFFMLVVGGFMYMASAGNTATATSARGIIADALLGIVAALGAYLILYVINPDLTKINIGFTTVNVEDVGPGPSTSGAGNCKAITTSGNACSVDNLKKFAQSKGMTSGVDDWATKASGICNAESSGIAGAKSMEGKCNGTSIAYGLYQINLNSKNVCPGAFTGTWKRGVSGGGCSVENQSILDACTKNALDVNWNLNRMWTLYNSRGWQPWEVFLKGTCSF